MQYNLGKLFSIQDMWPEARRAYAEAVRLDPAYMEAYDGLGFALEAIGEDAAAVVNYQKAAQINDSRKGTFAAPYANLSALYVRGANADAALEFARKAVEVNPKSDRGWFQMAKAHELRGELDAAFDALHRAIAINPSASSYYYVLATVSRRLGKLKESRDAMETFSRLERESNALEEKRREAQRR
jgi:tetratricopeptide (TPR) repeat protein